MTSKPDHRLIQLDRSLHAVGAVIACAILLGGLLLVRRSLAAERTSIDARIAEVAATGVDYISVGALTHSAPNFDIGLDEA